MSLRLALRKSREEAAANSASPLRAAKSQDKNGGKCSESASNEAEKVKQRGLATKASENRSEERKIETVSLRASAARTNPSSERKPGSSRKRARNEKDISRDLRNQEDNDVSELELIRDCMLKLQLPHVARRIQKEAFGKEERIATLVKGWLEYLVQLLDDSSNKVKSLQGALSILYARGANDTNTNKTDKLLLEKTKKSLVEWLKVEQGNDGSHNNQLSLNVSNLLVTWMAYLGPELGAVGKPDSEVDALVECLRESLSMYVAGSEWERNLAKTLLNKFEIEWGDRSSRNRQKLPSAFRGWFSSSSWKKRKQDVLSRTSMLLSFYRGIRLKFEGIDISEEQSEMTSAEGTGSSSNTSNHKSDRLETRFSEDDRRSISRLTYGHPSNSRSNSPALRHDNGSGAPSSSSHSLSRTKGSREVVDWETKMRIARVLGKCHSVNLKNNSEAGENAFSQFGEFCKYYQAYSGIHVTDQKGNSVKEEVIPMLTTEPGYTPKSLSWWGVQDPPVFRTRSGRREESGWSDDDKEPPVPKKSRKRTPVGI